MINMKLYINKSTRKAFAVFAATLFAFFFFVMPIAPSSSYAQTTSNVTNEALTAKGNFGILKKINNMFYIVNEFGDIVDTVLMSPGIDVKKYLGKYVLIKGNVIAGLAEAPKEYKKSFLPSLRAYFNGFALKGRDLHDLIFKESEKFPKKGKVKPVAGDPIIMPLYGVQPPEIIIEPISGPIMQPLYGVIEPKPIIEPIISPPMQLLYGVFEPKPIEIIEPDPIIRPLYGVEIKPWPIIEPGPPPMQLMYGVFEPPEVIIIEPEPIYKPLYGIEIEPQPIYQPLYGVEPPPVDGSVLDKIDVIEVQRDQYNQITSQGIKIVPELNTGDKPAIDPK